MSIALGDPEAYYLLNSRFLRNGIVTLVLVVGTAALLYMFIFPEGESDAIP